VPAKFIALREEADRILGLDLTTLPRISVLHAPTVLAEWAGDPSEFPSAGRVQFVDGIMPDNDISGRQRTENRPRAMAHALGYTPASVRVHCLCGERRNVL
jgi:hypothetical protein